MKVHLQVIIQFFLFLPFVVSAQEPIFVSDIATGTNNGSSWADAFTSLTEAFEYVNSGDTIWVKSGIYTPGDSPILSFELPSGVALFGGFAGTESNLEERDWQANETILSGNIDNQTSSEIILIAINPDTATIVDGFTIKDAFAYDSYLPCSELEPCHSGGIEVQFTIPEPGFGFTIRNCVIKENYSNQGAGMSVLGENVPYRLKINNCVFKENLAFFQAGGLFILGGGENIEITKSYFYLNNAWQWASGLFFHNSNDFYGEMILHDNVFESNKCDIGSGGISAYAGGLGYLMEIDSCRFFDNMAGDPNNYETLGDGGAITVLLLGEDAVNSLVISDSEFKGNYAKLYGGAILQSGRNILIENSVFSENYAERDGGAIFSGALNNQVINSVFHQNEVGERGGAIALRYTSPEIEYGGEVINCSFYNNIANFDGQAISINGRIENISNCLFWNHQSNEENHLLVLNDAEVYTDNNLFEVSDCASVFAEEGNGDVIFDCGPGNLFNIDPEFIDDDNENFRLEYCSPLIDAGSLGIVEQFEVETDMVGLNRVINAAPDIGAFENEDVLVQLYTQNLSCMGGDDGYAEVNPLGGNPPWSIEWSTGSEDLFIEGLEPNIYWVLLTDGNNCSRFWAFEIEESSSIVASYSLTDSWSQSSMDGAILVNQIEGGNPPYSYSWDTGDTSASLVNLYPGEYNLTLTDASDCDTVLTFTVSTVSSISEINKWNVSIAPNPGVEQIFINGLPVGTQWQFYNAIGQVVLEGLITQSKFPIQTEYLVDGIYFIRFFSGRHKSDLTVRWVKN